MWRHDVLLDGTDYGIDVAICTDAAFVAGQSGQWIRCSLDYAVEIDGELAAGKRSSSSRSTPVTPAVIRRAIDLVFVWVPPFTGRHGQPDVILDAAETRATVVSTATGFLDDMLVAADRALHAAPEAVLDAFDDIARILAADRPQDRERVDDWIATRSRELAALRDVLGRTPRARCARPGSRACARAAPHSESISDPSPFTDAGDGTRTRDPASGGSRRRSSCSCCTHR